MLENLRADMEVIAGLPLFRSGPEGVFALVSSMLATVAKRVDSVAERLPQAVSPEVKRQASRAYFFDHLAMVFDALCAAFPANGSNPDPKELERRGVIDREYVGSSPAPEAPRSDFTTRDPVTGEKRIKGFSIN